MMHIISLGAGVQSSTMALMAAQGEITPMPDCAIFSDTGNEPSAVYHHLDRLEKVLPFPVYRVTAGNLGEKTLELRLSAKSGKRYLRSLIPAFVVAEDNSKGLLGRRCTSDHKITPLIRKLRELLNMPTVRSKEILVSQWIGISIDEAHRMKPASDPWIKHRWPLIEGSLSRRDCEAWLVRHGWPDVPRSACLFCPFHSDTEWKHIKTRPEEFEQVIRFERNLQAAAAQCEVTRGVPYLHSSGVPIDQVDFDQQTNKGHEQLDLFGNECEGMCGV